MAATFNIRGVGTKFYGKRILAADGSYKATKFLVFFYLPIIPLGTYHLHPAESGNSIYELFSEKFHIEKVALCWGQIVNVYLAAIAIVFGGYALLGLFAK